MDAAMVTVIVGISVAMGAPLERRRGRRLRPPPSRVGEAGEGDAHAAAPSPAAPAQGRRRGTTSGTSVRSLTQRWRQAELTWFHLREAPRDDDVVAAARLPALREGLDLHATLCSTLMYQSMHGATRRCHRLDLGFLNSVFIYV
ncbi:hypothetical protein D1007_54418 [Hordeum vulgare]|nr:hypothetical protein D1007_54418 [Hordeum vulgare]